jgi:hypothetical protein
LTVDTDFVDIAREELGFIIGEALHTVAFKEGGRRWQGTMNLHKEFLRGALARNSMLFASNFFRRAAGLDVGRSQHRMSRPELEAQSQQIQANSQGQS